MRDASGVVLVVFLVGQAVIGAVWPTSLARLDATYYGPAVWQVTGTVLLFRGIALLVVAQLNLGASWRIGIEEGSRPGLVTSGCYRFCRNPIFFAILVLLTGYTLLLPTQPFVRPAGRRFHRDPPANPDGGGLPRPRVRRGLSRTMHTAL